MPIYESAAHPRPDDEFEPGELRHLASGARGRLLDPRRTPLSVVGVRPDVGFTDVRIEDFEDAGAVWEIPLEFASDFQFEPGGPLATSAEVAEMEFAIERLAHDQTITSDPGVRAQTDERVADRERDAATWLADHSRFLARERPLPDPAARRGDQDLMADLEAWMRERDLWDVEDEFSRVYVSNPGSGEVVKGHRIVLAELGLADYQGRIVRDPATFEGPWEREARAEHIVARLGFVRAVLDVLGLSHVRLWRGASVERRLRARPGRTFVSTSFDEAVARSHYESGQPTWTHVLSRHDVPRERVFMTYLETAAMNGVFLEAEAVLLAAPGDRWP